MTLKRITPVLLLLVFEAVSFAQVGNKANARVAGRITIDGQPAAGVQVLLKKGASLDDDSGTARPPALTATTNDDGHYQITNLPPGAYRLSVYAPAYVIEGEDSSSYQYGKTFSVAAGEDIDDLDFAMVHGGVITGKVTDEYGKPVIAEGVAAFRLDQQGKRDDTTARWQTDDRGVYRIFGLEAGRYIVGAGSSTEEQLLPVSIRGQYKRTYHPDVVEESNAKIVEVKPGGEVQNVDIKLARTAKGYTASGRVIDSETRKPLPGVMISCDLAKTAGSSLRMGSTSTNSNGEFHIEGLSPNSYVVYVFAMGQSENYSDRVNFEVADVDVTGLEIKLIRGASISGVAEVEGTRDPAMLARLSNIALRADAASQDNAMLMMLIMQGGSLGDINPDGTFRLGGVRPGRTRIVALWSPDLKGFMLARVEHNGVEVKEIDVAQGEQITGVRLIFTYGTSVVAGRVEIRGGTLPLSARMMVRAVRDGASAEERWLTKVSDVDARGQFSIEGLSPGNYKVHLLIYTNDGLQTNFPKVEQAIFVSEDTRREITLVLDLSKGGVQ